MLAAAEFEHWFRLLETPELGRGRARRLLAAFGDPAAILSAPFEALREVAGTCRLTGPGRGRASIR